MFGSEGIEAIDGIAEGAGIPHMLPRQSGKARYSEEVDIPSAYQTHVLIVAPGSPRKVTHCKGG